MRTAASLAGPQLFVLLGPVAGRVASSLSPQRSAVGNQPRDTRMLLETRSTSIQSHTLGPLSLEVGAADGQQLGLEQDDALQLNASALPRQPDRRQELGPLEMELARGQLATSGALLEPQWAATSRATHYEQEAVSLAATLARLTGWELVLVVALISLILISIVGNCLVCVAIFTDRRLRKLGNAFIVSLAIADLFVSCLVMTFALCNDLMDWWMFGERFCDIWISFDIMCCTASILNLCAISLDRFIHIKDCLLYNQLMTRRVAFSAVLGIWLVSALVSFVPINLGWHRPDHFGSATPAAATNASLMNVRYARVSANETHAILSAASARERPDDRLMYPERRTRRRAPPFGLMNRSAGCEQAGSGTAERREEASYLDRGAKFAQSATAGELWRSTNKDFVPTEGRARAGTRQQSAGRPSSGLNGATAQVDFWRGRRRGHAHAGSPANSYHSNRAASEMAPPARPKQSDDQVEFNPQDGPAGLGEQIKPQLRKKRNATEPPASRRAGAQTERSSGQRPDRSTALLDHADERPAPADVEGRAHSAALRGGPLLRAAHRNAATGHARGHGHLPQCTMTLTPTYAIISSTISFYIPCLIMLGLYSRLFACARRHVRNIRAITRAPHPIAATAATSATSLGAATNALTASNGASAASRPSSRPPESRATSSSLHSRTGQLNEPAVEALCSAAASQRRAPLASRARTWIKFATSRRPAGSHNECAMPQSPRLTGSTPAQSVSQLAGADDSASASGASSSANDRQAAEQPLARGLAAQRSPNEKTIDQAPAGCAPEHEPFLARRQSPAGRDNKPAISTTDDYCDNANDSSLVRLPSSAGKFAPNATSVKLNQVPSSMQQQQQQQAALAANQLQQQLHKQQQTSQLATHKAAITLGIIMGTFLFCWVPFFCLNIIKALYVDSIAGSMFRAFTWLGYANSALNPIIYGIHNSEFRNAFNRIFKHLTLKNGRHYLNRRFSHDLRPRHGQTRQPHAFQQPQQLLLQQECDRHANQSHHASKGDATRAVR